MGVEPCPQVASDGQSSGRWVDKVMLLPADVWAFVGSSPLERGGLSLARPHTSLSPALSGGGGPAELDEDRDCCLPRPCKKQAMMCVAPLRVVPSLGVQDV